MNRSRPSRWTLFQRHIVRADYHPSDPLFSPFGASSDVPTALFYLEKDKPWRSKLIAHRVRGCFDAALLTFTFVVLLIAFVGMTFEGAASAETVFISVIVVACLVASTSSLLKAQSWLRWTVRNWNMPMLAPRNRQISVQGHARLSATMRPGHHVGMGAVVEIMRVWFFSQFVRVQVKADYRVGDNIFMIAATPQMSGGLRDYPEEYLGSGKLWRSMMMLFRVVYLALALTILWVTAPWNWESEPDSDPVGWYFYGIVVMVSLRVAIPSQSFLRWMILNWNVEK